MPESSFDITANHMEREAGNISPTAIEQMESECFERQWSDSDQGIRGRDVRQTPALQMKTRDGTQQKFQAKKDHVTDGKHFRHLQQEYHNLEQIAENIDARMHAALSGIDKKDYLTQLFNKVKRLHILQMLIKPGQLPLMPDGSIPPEVLVKWKIEGGLSDSQINMICADVTGQKWAADDIKETVSQYAAELMAIEPEPGYSASLERVKITSIIDWTHLMLNIPIISDSIQLRPPRYVDMKKLAESGGRPEHDASSVLMEFSESPVFYEYYARALRTHQQANRKGQPLLMLYGQYQDGHSVFSGSLEAHTTCIMNMRRSMRNQAMCNLLDAELPGDAEDVQKLRTDQLPEWLILQRGVEMQCGTEGMQWIYGYVVAQKADTMEQCKNVSVKSPGGFESQYCCVRCMCTREEFSNLDLYSYADKERDTEETKRAIRKAANSDLNVTAATKILEDVGVSVQALANPTYWYVIEPFLSQPRETLHKLLNDCKEPFTALFTKKSIMPVVDQNIIGSRILAMRKQMQSSMAPRPLDIVSHMKGYEYWNLLSVSLVLVGSMLSEDWEHYLWVTSVLHWFLNSGSVNVGMWQHVETVLSWMQLEALQKVLPAGKYENFAERLKRKKKEKAESQREAGVRGPRKRNRQTASRELDWDDSEEEATEEEQTNFGPYRRTYYNHFPVHFPSDVGRYMSHCNVSANVDEGLQGKIADIAARNTIAPSAYASRLWLCRTFFYLSQLQLQPESTYAMEASQLSQSIIAPKRATWYKCLYYGFPIAIGAIAMQLYDWEPGK